MPFADSYNKTIYVDEDVAPTGTPDVAAANLNNNENFTKALSTALSGAVTDLEALEAAFASFGTNVYVNPTFVTGLNIEWVSATSFQIQSGACYTPGSGAIGELTAASTQTPSLAASTWYYVYAANVSGVLSFQTVTIAPILYRGTAKQKTGDPTWRFIDCFRTNASSQIIKWFPGFPAEEKRYAEHVDASTGIYRFVEAGTSQTEATVTNPGAIPPHSRRAYVNLMNISGVAVDIGNADDNVTLSNTATPLTVQGNDNFVGPLPLSSTQTFTYRYRGSGGGLYVNIVGFLQTR